MQSAPGRPWISRLPLCWVGQNALTDKFQRGLITDWLMDERINGFDGWIDGGRTDVLVRQYDLQCESENFTP